VICLMAGTIIATAVFVGLFSFKKEFFKQKE
jgi:hypothetical protein